MHKKRKKGSFETIILVTAFVIGLSLLLYPSLSNYWNSTRQSKAISSYSEAVAEISEEEYDRYWEDAAMYNKNLYQHNNGFAIGDAQKEEYHSLLNITGNGIMGYIEIPTINVALPIYHGTSDTVLQSAVGHLEWSSLPVGGESSHCVLSGHRGLPSAKLFTNLDQLTEGDTFVLRVLDEVLTYQVDQINIVDPKDISLLGIVDGQDLCTLVTCTPYGINTHRLLVRGHRVENEEEADLARVTPDAFQIEPLLVAPVIGIPMVAILLGVLLIWEHFQKKGNKKEDA